MMRVGLFSEDRDLRLLLSYALGKDFQLLPELDGGAAASLRAAVGCDIAILDLSSNNGSVQERVERAREMIESLPAVVLMAEDGLQAVAAELVRQGAYGYCRKPVSIRDLKLLLRRTHDTATIERQSQHAQQQQEIVSSCDALIGSSPQMQQVYQLVHRVANLNASVFVTGESGTGKELIARAIHNLGIRSNRPFVAVSCGAIPESLLEAELFGHEKGAFTGTVAAREGYFEQVGNGTLFLDEIGDLSSYAQVKLLRVLQQFEFSRLGSNRLIPLRARLIFATHQNLAEMVAQDKFRQDLYYRLNVIRINSPALREHPEDIPEIATHFLRHYSHNYQKQMDDIDPDAIALLQSYSWPGNVRELENVIQSSIVLARGRYLMPEDLPLHLQEVNVIGIDELRTSSSFERQIRDYKIKLAMAAVREHAGNKTLAARSLNISRAYLHRLLRLDEPDEIFEENPPKAEAM